MIREVNARLRIPSPQHATVKKWQVEATKKAKGYKDTVKKGE
jgi:hypothetical protein